MVRLTVALGLVMVAAVSLAWAGSGGATPWIGVGFDEGKEGVLISRVDPGGPGAQAGLRRGDQVTAIGTLPIRDSGDFVAAVQAMPLESETPFHIVRGPKPLTVLVRAQPRPHKVDQLRERWVGKSLSLSGLLPAAGPPIKEATPLVLVEFMATWCGSCKEAIPQLAKWQKRYDALHVVAVSDESPNVLRTYAQEHRVSYSLASDTDGQLARKLGVGVLPVFFVVHDGKVVHVEIGAGPALKRIDKRLRKLHQKPPRRR